MPRRVHDALYLQEAGCEGRGESAQRFLDKLAGMMQHASKQAHPIHAAEGLRLPTSVAEAAAAPPALSVPACPAGGGGVGAAAGDAPGGGGGVGAAAGDGRGGRGVGAGWEQAASRRSRRRRLWPTAGEQEAEAEGLAPRHSRRGSSESLESDAAVVAVEWGTCAMSKQSPACQSRTALHEGMCCGSAAGSSSGS